MRCRNLHYSINWLFLVCFIGLKELDVKFNFTIQCFRRQPRSVHSCVMPWTAESLQTPGAHLQESWLVIGQIRLSWSLIGCWEKHSLLGEERCGGGVLGGGRALPRVARWSRGPQSSSLMCCASLVTDKFTRNALAKELFKVRPRTQRCQYSVFVLVSIFFVHCP